MKGAHDEFMMFAPTREEERQLLAAQLHEWYEEFADEEGWDTQDGTTVPFDELPEENQQTMLRLADQVIEYRDLRFVRKVQSLTHDWRMDQFPDTTPKDQLIGAMQEVGELCEIEAKSTFEYQEFGGDNDAELQKELGDIFVYLMGYASLRGFDVDECIEMAANEVLTRNWDEC